MITGLFADSPGFLLPDVGCIALSALFSDHLRSENRAALCAQTASGTESGSSFCMGTLRTVGWEGFDVTDSESDDYT